MLARRARAVPTTLCPWQATPAPVTTWLPVSAPPEGPSPLQSSLRTNASAVRPRKPGGTTTSDRPDREEVEPGDDVANRPPTGLHPRPQGADDERRVHIKKIMKSTVCSVIKAKLGATKACILWPYPNSDLTFNATVLSEDFKNV